MPNILTECSKIALSERRQQVWGWVTVQSFERTFFQRTIAAELKLADSVVRPHVLALQGLALIRRLTPEEITSPTQAYAKVQPFIKLESDYWADIEVLVGSINPSALILPDEK